MASVVAFLEGKLRLKVNRAKSAIAPVGERSFLGHCLLPGGRLGLAPKSLDRVKERLRRITRRNRGIALERMIAPCGLQGSTQGDWASSQAPLHAPQATQARKGNRQLPCEVRRAGTQSMAASGLGQGMVASVRQSAGQRGRCSGLQSLGSSAFKLTTPHCNLVATAEYVKYEEGTARNPPTRCTRKTMPRCSGRDSCWLCIR